MYEFYELHQLSDLEFKYDASFSFREIDDWLDLNFKEGKDFNYGETTHGTHAYTVHIKFLNLESAMAFKLQWIV